MVEDNRAKWAAFIAKNAEILMTREELWQHNFQKSQAVHARAQEKTYPRKAGEEFLAGWLNNQIVAYNNKTLREDRRKQFEDLKSEFSFL